MCICVYDFSQCFVVADKRQDRCNQGTCADCSRGHLSRPCMRSTSSASSIGTAVSNVIIIVVCNYGVAHKFGHILPYVRRTSVSKSAAATEGSRCQGKRANVANDFSHAGTEKLNSRLTLNRPRLLFDECASLLQRRLHLHAAMDL